MIFSRNKTPPKRVNPNILSGGNNLGPQSDDDITDISRDLANMTPPPQQAAGVIPQAPLSSAGGPRINQSAAPMFFGPGDPLGQTGGARVPQEPNGRRAPVNPTFSSQFASPERAAPAQPQVDAEADARTARQARIDEGKQAGRARIQDIAANNAEELRVGRDINGDGKIGGESMYGGHDPTNQDLINQAVYDLLQPVDNDAERAAMDQQLAAANAQNIQSVRARAGIAGMGLTGAAGAAEGTEARRGSREQQLTLSEFDRNARAEQAARAQQAMDMLFEQQAFQLSHDQLELDRHMDLDGDGDIGGLPPDEAPDPDDTGPAGTPTDMPTDPAEVDTYVNALEERTRGSSGILGFGEMDPLVSGPHKIDGLTFYVYRRQDNNKLYRSQNPPKKGELAKTQRDNERSNK